MTKEQALEILNNPEGKTKQELEEALHIASSSWARVEELEDE